MRMNRSEEEEEVQRPDLAYKSQINLKNGEEGYIPVPAEGEGTCSAQTP